MRSGREAVAAAAIGDMLRRLRVEARMSQETLAQRAGLDTGSYGRIERGELCPRVFTLVCLADALGVRAAQLLDTVPRARDDHPPR